MSLWLQIFLYAVAGVMGIVMLVALIKTKKPVRALVGSGIQGVCALAAVNVAGIFTGVSLGLNLLTGLCCLILGIPGVISLLILKIIMNM